MPCSERTRPVREAPRTRRPAAGARTAFLLAALLVATGPLGGQETAGSSGSASGSQLRVDGEYGLWVGEYEGVYEVRWLTGQQPAPGLLRVLVGKGVRKEMETESGLAHHALFLPPSADSMSLRYGSPGRLHETRIRLGRPERDGASFPAADSLFVVGDTHGYYGRLRRILENAGVVDDEGRWSGGRARLVVLGDMMDRGPDVTRLLWYLYGLERRAEAAGGRVHVVLGNHEIMVMTEDLRYVAPKEREIARRHGISYSRMYDPRHSVLGRWLLSKPVAVRIGEVLLAHGGVGPAYAEYGIEALNDSLAAYMSEPIFRYWTGEEGVVVPSMERAAVERRKDFFFRETGVVWFRGYVFRDDMEEALARVLKNYGAEVHVVGHSPVDSIESRYGGRLIAVDVHDPATEMLLLVRTDDGYARYRYSMEGPPVRF